MVGSNVSVGMCACHQLFGIWLHLLLTALCPEVISVLDVLCPVNQYGYISAIVSRNVIQILPQDVVTCFELM